MLPITVCCGAKRERTQQQQFSNWKLEEKKRWYPFNGLFFCPYVTLTGLLLWHEETFSQYIVTLKIVNIYNMCSEYTIR